MQFCIFLKMELTFGVVASYYLHGEMRNSEYITPERECVSKKYAFTEYGAEWSQGFGRKMLQNVFHMFESKVTR